MKPIINVIFILASVICGTNYSIASNLVINGSFESFTGSVGGNGTPSLTASSSDLTGWNITNDEIVYISKPNSTNVVASNGDRSLDLSGVGNSHFPKGISQTLTNLTSGQSYRFEMDLGILNGPAFIGGGNIFSGPIEVKASIDNVASETFTHNSSDAGNVWGRYGFDFIANTTNMLLVIEGISLPNGNHYIGLDNISVETNPVNAVPLPAGLWLFGTGLLTILGGIKKRQLSLTA